MADYYQKIVISNGGIVGRCQECKRTDGLRFVTETTKIYSSVDHHYRLCDACADKEKALFARHGAEIVDGRPTEREAA